MSIRHDSLNPFFIREVILTASDLQSLQIAWRNCLNPFFIREVILTLRDLAEEVTDRIESQSLLHQGSNSDLADGEVQGRICLLTGIGEAGDDGEVFLIGKKYSSQELFEILEDICLSEENIREASDNLKGSLWGDSIGKLMGKIIMNK